MAKAEKAEVVKVVLSCIYSGLEQSHNPGDVLETDAEEAARLIEIGAATAYVPVAEGAGTTD
ncbi:hypothetical protein [Microcystis phage Mae-JY02]